MSPGLRKFVLTTHVAVSVGWMGTVAGFLVLSVIGLTSDDPDTVRGVYLVMEPAAWFALVPLALTSLVIGVAQSLGTPWGLVRHYWVIFKLLINVVSALVLVTYMNTFEHMADVAANPDAALTEVRNESPVLHGAAALVLLLVATVLSVYKPKGLTAYGARRQREGQTLPAP